MTYSYLHSVIKGTKYAVIFLLAQAILILPIVVKDKSLWDLVEYSKPYLSTITAGGVLVAVYNYLKYRWNLRI
ncbi:MAG: hypothetical protein PHT54_03485 [Candidatus Nanoarchaeia archaeon]|nr:hypothetical protein [Candidatus Nanoarchaeia archaeon]